MAGLIQLGNSARNNAIQGLNTATELEQKRKEEGKMAKAADQAQDTNMIGMGAAGGLMAGLGSAGMGAQFGVAAGPVGMLAGAALGYAFGELF